MFKPCRKGFYALQTSCYKSLYVKLCRACVCVLYLDIRMCLYLSFLVAGIVIHPHHL